jgi:hypothetical protein
MYVDQNQGVYHVIYHQFINRSVSPFIWLILLLTSQVQQSVYDLAGFLLKVSNTSEISVYSTQNMKQKVLKTSVLCDIALS